MREIKFRAWYQEKMCDVTNISMWQGQVSTLRVKPTGSGEYAASITDTPIMQYTGLTDKNGKEIYEGDLVRMFADSLNGEETVEVKWRKEGFWEYFNGFDNCEVIGNIHENPELLA